MKEALGGEFDHVLIFRRRRSLISVCLYARGVLVVFTQPRGEIKVSEEPAAQEGNTDQLSPASLYFPAVRRLREVS